MKSSILLVPGFGAQGGSAADVAAAFDENGTGAVINSSRGVIFAYEKEKYASQAAKSWQDAVANLRSIPSKCLRHRPTRGSLHDEAAGLRLISASAG